MVADGLPRPSLPERAQPGGAAAPGGVLRRGRVLALRGEHRLRAERRGDGRQLDGERLPPSQHPRPGVSRARRRGVARSRSPAGARRSTRPSPSSSAATHPLTPVERPLELTRSAPSADRQRNGDSCGGPKPALPGRARTRDLAAGDRRHGSDPARGRERVRQVGRVEPGLADRRAGPRRGHLPDQPRAREREPARARPRSQAPARRPAPQRAHGRHRLLRPRLRRRGRPRRPARGCRLPRGRPEPMGLRREHRLGERAARAPRARSSAPG